LSEVNQVPFFVLLLEIVSGFPIVLCLLQENLFLLLLGFVEVVVGSHLPLTVVSNAAPTVEEHPDTLYGVLYELHYVEHVFALDSVFDVHKHHLNVLILHILVGYCIGHFSAIARWAAVRALYYLVLGTFVDELLVHLGSQVISVFPLELLFYRLVISLLV